MAVIALEENTPLAPVEAVGGGITRESQQKLPEVSRPGAGLNDILGRGIVEPTPARELDVDLVTVVKVSEEPDDDIGVVLLDIARELKEKISVSQGLLTGLLQ